jgi:hypothetical protein
MASKCLYIVNVVYCTIRRRGVFFLISSADSELSPELYLSFFCSYNWQFKLQILHLQQCELFLIVGIVFVGGVTVKCMQLSHGS